MNPGILDRVIEIQSYAVTRGAMGGETKAWSTFHSCRAKMTDNKGVEKVVADKETAISDTMFKIRYKQGIDTTMRVVYESENYEIKSINRIGRKEILELYTKKLK